MEKQLWQSSSFIIKPDIKEILKIKKKRKKIDCKAADKICIILLGCNRIPPHPRSYYHGIKLALVWNLYLYQGTISVYETDLELTTSKIHIVQKPIKPVRKAT